MYIMSYNFHFFPLDYLPVYTNVYMTLKKKRKTTRVVKKFCERCQKTEGSGNKNENPYTHKYIYKSQHNIKRNNAERDIISLTTKK